MHKRPVKQSRLSESPEVVPLAVTLCTYEHAVSIQRLHSGVCIGAPIELGRQFQQFCSYSFPNVIPLIVNFSILII